MKSNIRLMFRIFLLKSQNISICTTANTNQN